MIDLKEYINVNNWLYCIRWSYFDSLWDV